MFTKQELEGALRKALAAALGGLLALALLSSLLIAGVILLLWAATSGLAPVVGEAGALAITGLSCFVLLGLFFWRLTRTPAPSDGNEDGGKSEPSETPVDVIRNLIRNNPWESIVAAFALGIVGQGDARMKSLILKGGMLAMREAELERKMATTAPRNDQGDDVAKSDSATQ
ncbi:hypothetical protein [uncultured Marinobacter sp.]|uniref:hypothetical protein n=1 Tax=uncultured Marinobacter sp. TaxID=187379 RepID=UPI0030D829BD